MEGRTVRVGKRMHLSNYLGVQKFCLENEAPSSLLVSDLWGNYKQLWTRRIPRVNEKTVAYRFPSGNRQQKRQPIARAICPSYKLEAVNRKSHLIHLQRLWPRLTTQHSNNTKRRTTPIACSCSWSKKRVRSTSLNIGATGNSGPERQTKTIKFEHHGAQITTSGLQERNNVAWNSQEANPSKQNGLDTGRSRLCIKSQYREAPKDRSDIEDKKVSCH